MANKEQLLQNLFEAMEAKITAQAAYEDASIRADAAWERYMACLKEASKVAAANE